MAQTMNLRLAYVTICQTKNPNETTRRIVVRQTKWCVYHESMPNVSHVLVHCGCWLVCSDESCNAMHKMKMNNLIIKLKSFSLKSLKYCVIHTLDAARRWRRQLNWACACMREIHCKTNRRLVQMHVARAQHTTMYWQCWRKLHVWWTEICENSQATGGDAGASSTANNCVRFSTRHRTCSRTLCTFLLPAAIHGCCADTEYTFCTVKSQQHWVL